VKLYLLFILLFAHVFVSIESFADNVAKNQEDPQKKVVAKPLEIAKEESVLSEISSFSSYSAVALVIFLILAFLSLFSWAVLLFKWSNLKRAEKNSKSFLLEFSAASSLDSLYKSLPKHPASPVKEIFSYAYQDFANFDNNFKKYSRASSQIYCEIVLDHFSRSMHKIKVKEKINLEKFLSFLAITASTAPFIGLLGTVCGIINAFDAIALSGSNSLSAVAPGISEALVATAFGLVAAIPAVVGYNWSYTRIKLIMASSEALMSDFVSIVQRYLLEKTSDK
jgi:biopolymer transport protein TolQ